MKIYFSKKYELHKILVDNLDGLNDNPFFFKWQLINRQELEDIVCYTNTKCESDMLEKHVTEKLLDRIWEKEKAKTLYYKNAVKEGVLSSWATFL